MLTLTEMKWRYFKAFSRKYAKNFVLLGFVDTLLINWGPNSVYWLAAIITSLLVLYSIASMIELGSMLFNQFNLEIVKYEGVKTDEEKGQSYLIVKTKHSGKLFTIPTTPDVIESIKQESENAMGQELLLLYRTLVFKRFIWIDVIEQDD